MPEVRNVNAKPSGPQIFGICRALCEVAGLPFPETRLEASQLLERIRADRDALVAAGAITSTSPAAREADPIPF